MTNSQRPFPRKAFGTLIAGACTIGAAPILVRLSESEPVATAVWRMAFALPFLWSGMVWHQKRVVEEKRPALSGDRGHKSKRPFQRKHLSLFITAGTFFAADLTLWHSAISRTTIANATLLPNFFPLFVTLGSWLIFKQRFTRIFLIGMGMALAGASLLIGINAQISQQTLVGDLLALATAVVYAGYFLTIAQLRKSFSAPAVLLGSSMVSFVLLLIESLLLQEPLLGFSWQGWLTLIGLGLVVHSIGQGLITYALAHLQPAFSSVTMILQPLIATIVAWQLFNETLSPLQGLGGLIVLAGIWTAQRGS